MSDIKLPPQESPRDTSNWDGRAFNTPMSTSVGKVKKSVERRQLVLDSPERIRHKKPKSLAIERIEKAK